MQQDKDHEEHQVDDVHSSEDHEEHQDAAERDLEDNPDNVGGTKSDEHQDSKPVVDKFAFVTSRKKGCVRNKCFAFITLRKKVKRR
jgi:hypothetical protein